MARIFCIDGFPVYSEMVANLMRSAGHEVMVELTPISLETLLKFKPDLITLSLVRSTDALGDPIDDFDQQVLGSEAFRMLADNAARLPAGVLATGTSLVEKDVPPSLPLLGFLEVPRQLDDLNDRVREILANRRS